MKSFKELGIKPVSQGLQGDKIKIERVLNREIIVHKYKIESSKFQDKGNGKCLYLQIELNGNMAVIFTGSTVLMDMIQRVDQEDFPFKATIVKESDSYQFT